jgi:hypothetical protein
MDGSGGEEEAEDGGPEGKTCSAAIGERERLVSFFVVVCVGRRVVFFFDTMTHPPLCPFS